MVSQVVVVWLDYLILAPLCIALLFSALDHCGSGPLMPWTTPVLDYLQLEALLGTQFIAQKSVLLLCIGGQSASQ